MKAMAKPFRAAQRTDYQSLWTKATSSQWCAAIGTASATVGLRLIVASWPLKMEVLLKAAQVDDLLDEITTSSDAEASKPSPDIVEAALSKLNMQPDQVLMLVTHPMIQAASAAGVGMIAVRCGFDGSSGQGDLR